MRDCLAIAPLRSREICLPLESGAQGAPRPGVRGSDRQRPLIAGDGFFQVAAVAEGIPQIEVGFREVRLQSESVVEAGGRFLEPASTAQGFAEVRVSGGIRRLERDDRLQTLDRRCELADLKGDEAEVMESRSMPWRDAQNLPEKSLRFGQAPSLVMLLG
jgi:hypothetical protein